MLTCYLFAVFDEVLFQMILISKYALNFEIIFDLQGEGNAKKKRGTISCTPSAQLPLKVASPVVRLHFQTKN